MTATSSMILLLVSKSRVSLVQYFSMMTRAAFFTVFVLTRPIFTSGKHTGDLTLQNEINSLFTVHKTHEYTLKHNISLHCTDRIRCASCMSSVLFWRCMVRVGSDVTRPVYLHTQSSLVRPDSTRRHGATREILLEITIFIFMQIFYFPPYSTFRITSMLSSSLYFLSLFSTFPPNFHPGSSAWI